MHVCIDVHVCKQIGLEMNFGDAAIVLDAAYCELDAMKTEYAQLATATKRRQKNRRKRVLILILMSMPHYPCNDAAAKVKEAKLAVMTAI